MDEEAIMGLAEGLVRAVFLEASTAFMPASCACRLFMSAAQSACVRKPSASSPLLEMFHRLPCGIAAHGAGYFPVLWSKNFA